MTTLHKEATRKTLNNLNKKCGEISFCTQVGKRVYALNCLYCPQICLQFEIYINHMEVEHDDDLKLDPVPQGDTDVTEFDMENETVESHEKCSSLNVKLDEFDAFDDPLESESSTSQKYWRSTIKVEKVDCTQSINLFENTNSFQQEQIDTDKDYNNIIRINDVFKGNPVYTELRSYYEKYGQLGTAEQNKLTRTVIDYYVSKNIKLESNYLDYLASQIVKLFPNEAQEVYFEKQKNQRAKGKLYFRYQNMLKVNVKPYRKPQQYIEKRISFLGNEQDSSKIKSFLKYNFTDKKETCQRWQQSMEYRLKELVECKDSSIANIVENWPAYKQSFGVELISFDFDSLYPEKNQNFLLNWTKLNSTLPTYLDMNLKDSKLKSVWDEAKERWVTLNQNSKDGLLLYLMHGVLKPERVSREVGKATIAESQLSAIKFVDEDIKLNLYVGHSPFLLVKKSVFCVDEIFVVAYPIVYRMDTMAAALSLCFKIHQVFNLSYNMKCINFWLFVQKILFEIHLEDDHVGNSLRSISSFFQLQK